MTDSSSMVRVDPLLYERASRTKPGYLSKAAFINTLIEKGLSQYGSELRDGDYRRRPSSRQSAYAAND